MLRHAATTCFCFNNGEMHCRISGPTDSILPGEAFTFSYQVSGR